MNEKVLEKLKASWKEWVRREVFASPTAFNYDKALRHLREGRHLLSSLAEAVGSWHPVFPPQLLPQDKYQDLASPSYWRTKFQDNLSEADRELLKGVRHLETLLGYYETEQASEDASYLEDFAGRNEVTLEKVITTWGREDFEDSIDAADKILSNRSFRNLKTLMNDLRDAEHMMSSQQQPPSPPVHARVAFFQGASDAEYALEELFLDLLPGTDFEDKVFAVGGYVRDELVGTPPNDLDIVIEAQYGAQRFADFLEDTFPEAVTDPEPLTLAYPIWHLTFTDDVEWNGKTYEVGGAELDIADTQTLADGTTVYGPVEDDAARRDFTVNMLFKNLSTGEIVDPTGVGKMDLERGLLRGYPDADALEAFADQPKRMLRLVRFQTRYDWDVDPTIEEALRMSVEHLLDLTDETVLWEFGKLRKAGVFNDAWELMREYGMLPYLYEVLYGDEEDAD